MSQYQKPVNIRHPKVDAAVRDFLGHKIGRREMLRRAGYAGMGAFGLASLSNLQRAGAQDATPEVAIGSTIEMPELRTDLEGQSITVVLADSSSPDNAWLDAAIGMFSEATGITVDRVFGESSATDRLQNYRQQFAAESRDIDVFQIDVIWPGIVAPFALDLNESLSDLADEHFEAIVQNNTVDGALVGMPWFTDAGLLYRRTDLMEKYGYSDAPATWTELEEMATAIQEGEQGEGNAQFQGYIFQGAAYEGLTCNGLEWQVSNGGGFIVNGDSGEITVNNEQAIAAFDRAASWVGGISPDGVVNFQEPDNINVWVPGNAAFMRNWPYAFAASQDEGSNVAGNVDVSVLPMGDGDEARNAATLGGWQMMVSRFSEAPDAGVEFTRFMCSPGVQRSFAAERAHLPTIADVYDDAVVAESSGFIPRLRDVFSGGAVARPSSITGELYAEVSQAYFQQLNAVLNGSQDGATAAQNIEDEIDSIMSGL